MTDPDPSFPPAGVPSADLPAADSPANSPAPATSAVAPEVVGLDLDNENTAAPAPLTFDVDWDAVSPAAGTAGSWLDLQPEPTPVSAPNPNWPLGPTPSAVPMPTESAPVSGSVSPPPPSGSVPSPPPVSLADQPAAQPQQARTFEVYRPPTAPYAPSAPSASPGPRVAAGYDPGYAQPVPYQQLAVSTSMASSASTTWASAAHWSGPVAGLVTSSVLGFVGPLIVFVSQGRADPYVRAHAVEALNFQLTMLICMGVSLIALVIVVGVAGLVAFPLLNLICSILGAIAAARGKPYRYPINFRMVK